MTLRKESREGAAGAVSLLGLTPGTPFMAAVERGLAFYACQRLQSRAWQDVAFEVSGPTVPVGVFSGMFIAPARFAVSVLH